MKDSQFSRRDAIFTALSLLPFAQSVGAQETQPPPKFSSSVKVVNVLATVRDKKGNLVKDLSKDDFALEEDGHPQTIAYFSRQTSLPLTVGLLIDTSGSERRMIGQEKDASHTFLEDVLRPSQDQAFLIHFDREVELVQDLTSSREKLEKALDNIDRPEFGHGDDTQTGQSGGGSGGGSGNPDDNGGGWPNGGGRGGGGGRGRGQGGQRSHGGTQLYDAVYLASDELMKKQAGRKALILLTDGADNGSKVSLSEAITAAQRSDTLAYSIYITDESGNSPFGGFGGPGMGRHGGMGRGGGGGPYGGSRPDGKKILQQISRETGGAFFEYSKKKTVGDIYQQLEEELRSQYSIGYSSNQPESTGNYRKIQLTVKDKKNLVVQARDGYYAS